MIDSYKCILGDFSDGPVLRAHLAMQGNEGSIFDWEPDIPHVIGQRN